VQFYDPNNVRRAAFSELAKPNGRTSKARQYQTVHFRRIPDQLPWSWINVIQIEVNFELTPTVGDVLELV